MMIEPIGKTSGLSRRPSHAPTDGCSDGDSGAVGAVVVAMQASFCAALRRMRRLLGRSGAASLYAYTASYTQYSSEAGACDSTRPTMNDVSLVSR